MGKVESMLAILLTFSMMLCWCETAVAEKQPLTKQTPENKLNPELLKMPANTWVHLKSERSPVGRSYSGIGGAIGRGYVFYFGGGHGSHPGNDVELYHIASNRWVQATEMEDWHDADKWTHLTPEERKKAKGIGGGWGVPYVSPKGRPLTQHTYQQTCYDPEGKRFISVLSSGTWAFDPEKREWQALAGKYAPSKGVSPSAWTSHLLTFYDPVLGAVVCFVGGGGKPKGIYVFDGKSNTWKWKKEFPIRGNEWYTTYVPDLKMHLIATYSDGKLRWFDSSKLELREVTSKPPEALIKNISMAYDTNNKVVVVARRDYFKKGPIVLWAYAPLEDRWEKLSLKGEPPKGTTAWNQLVYDQDHKCFLFLNVLSVGSGGRGGRTDGLFAFRLEQGSE